MVNKICRKVKIIGDLKIVSYCVDTHLLEKWLQKERQIQGWRFYTLR